MLAFVRDGDNVLVHSMDRLARNLDDLRALVRTLTGRGVRVQFMKEQLTFAGEDTAMATLLLSVMGAFAGFERLLVRERQREGMAGPQARRLPGQGAGTGHRAGRGHGLPTVPRRPRWPASSDHAGDGLPVPAPCYLSRASGGAPHRRAAVRYSRFQSELKGIPLLQPGRRRRSDLFDALGARSDAVAARTPPARRAGGPGLPDPAGGEAGRVGTRRCDAAPRG